MINKSLLLFFFRFFCYLLVLDGFLKEDVVFLDFLFLCELMENLTFPLFHFIFHILHRSVATKRALGEGKGGVPKQSNVSSSC